VLDPFSWRRLAVATVGGVCLAAGLGASPALADSGQQQLMPDPDAYCALNAPYQAQVTEAGWQVVYTGLSGDANQNDWACTYTVYANIPVPNGEFGPGADTASAPLPPSNETFPIDWAAMCRQQYDGSSLQWVGVPGPETSPGPFGAPWMCLGAPGGTYDQTETQDGPVGRVS
jgi:hypothetical protein